MMANHQYPDHVVRKRAEQHRIREAANQAAPNIGVCDSVAQRADADSIDGRVNLLAKCSPRPGWILL